GRKSSRVPTSYSMMMIKSPADIGIPLANSASNAVVSWVYYGALYTAPLFTLRGELNCLENFLDILVKSTWNDIPGALFFV
ncbi:MAG: hypothetical protein OET79_07105, partial [Nitrospirota bacterium]|nr:hypothetical protein [Nitrospirota bacterium]